jgi:hypothetical protein
MTKRYVVIEWGNKGGKDEGEWIFNMLLSNSKNHLFPLGTRIIAAGTYSAALSGIQTLFTRTRLPIYFFFDAGETSSDESEDKESFARDYLKPLFNNKLYFFPFKPEIESLFFYKKDLLEKIVNRPITDDLWQKGQVEPKKVLLELTDSRLSNLNLNPETIAQLQESPPLQDIIKQLSAELTNELQTAIAA